MEGFFEPKHLLEVPSRALTGPSLPRTVFSTSKQGNPSRYFSFFFFFRRKRLPLEFLFQELCALPAQREHVPFPRAGAVRELPRAPGPGPGSLCLPSGRSPGRGSAPAPRRFLPRPQGLSRHFCGEGPSFAQKYPSSCPGGGGRAALPAGAAPGPRTGLSPRVRVLGKRASA